jgi:hypothetical protein
MNPLQKKCVIATASLHGLLVLILFVGPGFFRRETPPDNLPMLKVIPLTAIDAALNSGVARATPPPAAPVTPPTPVTPPPEPTPEPPKPVVTPEQPVQPPKTEEPDTPDEKTTEEPSPLPLKPKHKIEVDITKTVVRKVTKTHDDTAQKEAEERAEARAERDEERKREREISRITGSLEHNLSHSTDVEMPGNSSASYANYGQIVKSIYEQAWIPPDDADNDNANPLVHVVIASDGTVISAHLTEPSGDAAVDASVRRVLERVKFIHDSRVSGRLNRQRTILQHQLQP